LVKHVREERNTPPWQMVLGCMDTVYCVLVRIALFLGMNLSRNPSASQFIAIYVLLYDITVPGGGQKIKDIVPEYIGSANLQIAG
jgi:hypothetical protein